MGNEQEKLTLEERIAQAARSQAASPETAVKLVEQFAKMQTVLLFHGSEDLARMSELIGPYMEQMEEDLFHYSGFCYSINSAFSEEAFQEEADMRFRPALGLPASNAVVLLGLMLLDHAKGRGKHKEVYHYTRMNLTQYLDALETLAFPGNEPPGESFRRWRKQFQQVRDPRAPLADELAFLLRQYIRGWKTFDHLDHVLRCMEDLSSYLEEEKTADLDRCFRESMRQCIAGMGLTGVEVVEDEREHYPDPAGHYMDLARSYSCTVPDPDGEEISAGAVRDQIFLPDRDFSPAALRTMAEEAPTSEFRALLEELISERRLSLAMGKINAAVSDLFMLYVGPYLWMDERLQSETR